MFPDWLKDKMINIYNQRKSTKKAKNSFLKRLNEYSDLLKALWVSRSTNNHDAEYAIKITINHLINPKIPIGFDRYMTQNRTGTNFNKSKRKYRRSKTNFSEKRMKKM